MTFDDHHNPPPRVWCARGMRKPKPGCCWARRLLFDRHSRRPLLVAEKKGLHRLQWMRTLRFMSFFFQAIPCFGMPKLGSTFDAILWEFLLGNQTRLPRAGPTSSEDLTRVKPSEGLPNGPSCCPFEDGFGFEDFGKKSQKWYGFICSVFEGPEQTTLSWAFFATCCSLQLQTLPRKWKVIQKLEGRHYRSLQNW